MESANHFLHSKIHSKKRRDSLSFGFRWSIWSIWSICNDKSKHQPEMGMGQNPIPLVNIKIAGKWMFIPLKMVSIGIYP